MFLLNENPYNHVTVQFCLASHCYRSAEPIYKNNKQSFLDDDEFFTNEEIRRKNFGK